MKEAKRMEYDRHILSSNNIMKTLWKLIIKELARIIKIMGYEQ
jgi:hypothetical protein